ncbi:transcriptional regulator with XRE-family HTH domain [Streptosporangium becharense]|uniref:Transcriptional regulator with XRE-family HTH domain n=1 Tax=Streptosporangium becharense TaxID=1816182 RepID=A0A7W9IHR0_9ACTN|nr:helix-turn-helix transcriptional regulator [Streptosporangium becharense]MBB2914920.1 transcriptional regulator with XRE-family HTH domain [Streptosporangium becharense]MBB5820269.1 transcriptional regulator with XRE-family HTH domain [Streptosporangium becharense]
MTTPQMPEPPPEAVLVRRVRKAKRLSIPQTAQAAGISAARLSQIENGYETKKGQYVPVTAPAGTLAHIWAALEIAPERLAEVGRDDALGILAEIHAADHVAQVAPAPTVETWRQRILEIEELSQSERQAVITLIEAMRSIQPQGNNGNGETQAHSA